MLSLSDQDRGLIINNKNKFFKKNQTWSCRAPFTTLNVGKSGECYICYSPSWLPVNIGNAFLDSLERIWFGSRANSIRKTVYASDDPASFFYCNSKICPFLKHVDLRSVTKEDLKFKESNAIIPPVQYPNNLNLDFDHTCNFSCEMCRKKLIIDKRKELMLLAESVCAFLDNVPHEIEVKLNGGEPFMSEPYKFIIKHVIDKKHKHVKFQIASNGSTIITNKDLIIGISSSISSFRISFDASSQLTYEKIRKGGNWQNFLKNLLELKNLKNKYRFKIMADFLVQKDNWREILDYVSLADDLDFDRISVQKMWNWGTWSQEEFDERNVFDAAHPEHDAMISLVRSIENDKFDVPWINPRSHESVYLR